jgi:rhodanese-related sulfurtransferase
MNLLEAIFGKSNPSLDVAELKEKLKNGKHPLVLDVRQPEEYRMGHIAGAKLIPLDDLIRKMQTLPKNREIVCVCASGNRSSSATRLLVNAGYNAFNMKGGMASWHRAGFAIKKGDAAG